MSDTVTARGPQVRVRIQHTSTVKEGWRVGETTVEYTSGSDGTIDWDRIEDEMRSAFISGSREAAVRNAGLGA